MQKTVVKLNASTIYQLEAGEHKAVVDGGDLYLLVQSVETIGGATTSGETAPKASATEVKAEPIIAEKAEEVGTSNAYTEDEMMDMEIPELMKICKDLGIDPSSSAGRNTNKKLRLLILEHQDGSGAEVEDDNFEEEAPKATGRSAEVKDDTAPASGGRSRRSRSQDTAEDSGPEEILPEAWDDLKEDDLVLVKLDLDDAEESAKLWEAKIIGWDTPKGVKEEKLFVFFLEDETEDYLRDTDRLFKYQKQI